MAYNPTTWKTGDVVTSAKLNKIESGVEEACSSYTVTSTASDYVAEQSVTTDEYGSATVDTDSKSLSDFSEFSKGYVKVDGETYEGEMSYYYSWHIGNFPEGCPVSSVNEGYVQFVSEAVETHTIEVFFMTEEVTTSHNFDLAVSSLTAVQKKWYVGYSGSFTASAGSSSINVVYQDVMGNQISPPTDYDFAVVTYVGVPSGLRLDGFSLDEWGNMTIYYTASASTQVDSAYCASVEFIKFGSPFEETESTDSD